MRTPPRLVLSLAVLAAMPAAAAGQIPADFAQKAQAGAPAAISAKSTIAHIDVAGKAVHVVRQGTNGFTCSLMPDSSDAPFCADAQGWQFLVDALLGKPKPTSTAPGVGYMAAGGMHFELPDGQIVMAPGPNTKAVQEPPHWMLLWPVDAATSGLPTKATAPTYIMFAGTPFAHLMVYQDPAAIVK
ncbi:MAG: hypothetical protein ACREL9_07945 [Gemmatimonadales bacterium]